MGATTAIAIYAALVSTITGTVQLLSYRRDRANIKLSTRKQVDTFEINGEKVEGSELYTVLVVANDGRRPIMVMDVCARLLFPLRGLESLACNPKIPFQLTEGTQLTALVDDEQINVAEVEAWEVHDAVGRRYRLNVAPMHTRLYSRLRRLLS